MHVRNGKIDKEYAEFRLSSTSSTERIDEVLPLRRTGINMKKRAALEDGRSSPKDIYDFVPEGETESLADIRKKIVL